MEKEEKKKELNHNQNFVEQISNSMSQLDNSKSIEEATIEIENLVLCYIQNLYKTKKNFMQCVENSKSK